MSLFGTAVLTQHSHSISYLLFYTTIIQLSNRSAEDPESQLLF